MSEADEAQEIVARLRAAEEHFLERPDAREHTLRVLGRQVGRAEDEGPSSYIVGRVASITGAQPRELLGMTATRRRLARPTAALAEESRSLRAVQLLDTTALRVVSQANLGSLLQRGGLRVQVAEAAAEEAYTRFRVRDEAVRRVAEITRTVAPTDMREVEAVRAWLTEGHESAREPMLWLGDAETTAAALRLARAGTPARIVTLDGDLAADLEADLGVPTQGLWNLVAEVGGELGMEDWPLRDVRTRFDRGFDQTTPWPRQLDRWPPPEPPTPTTRR